MLRAAKISFNNARRSTILFGAINSAAFMLLFIIFNGLNILHVFGLSLVNFVILFLISILQFKLQIKKSRGYIPFLQSFFSTLVTGTLAYALFAGYLFLYSLINPQAIGLYVADNSDLGTLTPFVLLFFQGFGGSIIVALAASLYTARYEDGEVDI